MRETHDHSARSDVVVAGGGLAGLTAALALARHGRSVTLLEKSKHLGGRAVTRRENDFCWNLGAHALYRRGHASRVFAELGIRYTGGTPSPSGGFAVARGNAYALPGGLVSLLSTGLLPLAAKLELARLMAGIGRIDPEPVRNSTLADWLAANVRHAGVRDLLAALTRLTTYCNAEQAISAGDAIEQLQLALSSNVLYLDDGWQTLVDGLAAAAQVAGVRIELSAAARSIEGGERVCAVRLSDGRVLAAEAVIAAIPPDAVADLGGASLSPAFAARLASATPLRAACLDVALTSLPVARATFALGVDRPLYLSVHSAVARLAKDRAVIHLMKYLAPHEQAGREDERELEGLLDLVQPGWRALLVERRFLPSMVVGHALPAADLGGKRGRPAIDGAGIGGLYVAGDWAGDAGLLADAAVASARAAAGRCHEYLAQRAAEAA